MTTFSVGQNREYYIEIEIVIENISYQSNGMEKIASKVMIIYQNPLSNRSHTNNG